MRLEKRSQLVGTAQPPAVPTIRGRKRQNFEGLRLRAMELLLPENPWGLPRFFLESPKVSQGFPGFLGASMKNQGLVSKRPETKENDSWMCLPHSTHVGESGVPLTPGTVYVN